MVRVDRLSAYVDIGRIVNMSLARQQIDLLPWGELLLLALAGLALTLMA